MTLPWETPPTLSPRDFAVLRKRMIFECCKWDPQVEDVSALAPYPIVLRERAWALIAEAARCLFLETLAL